ncbi:MAG: leucyl/phenylalanyl-tRNA--protein transferase [Pelagimonas sp.]|uniref:leucyl/phenylalanyl-tRNA--protein transferase n=1 Tax=Pelagimonas sp. TaxID=2073170 RepID=UPI003D6A4993
MQTVTADLLLQAYCSGIFPMAEHRDDPELFWVDPRHRGILPLESFHISKSLAKRLRRDQYRVTLNEDFEGVLQGCANRQETWISTEIRSLYTELHQKGFAHSLEVWADGDLIGGVYGVCVGRAFCGESMFSTQTDGSKIALAWLVDLLRRCGFTLFDTQFLTPHLASLGGIEIPRDQYKSKLTNALQGNANILSHPLAASGQDVVQRNTQTS